LGSRLIISWNPDSSARNYEVEVSQSDSFSTTLATGRVDGTNWAPDINLSLPTSRGRLYWRVAALDSFGTVGSFATGSFLNRPPQVKHRRAKARKRHR
jgi:hypothetical protein